MIRPGPRNLITDVAGLRVGNARDDRIKTGVTVLVGDRPFTAAVHVMGGAPGTRSQPGAKVASWCGATEQKSRPEVEMAYS